MTIFSNNIQLCLVTMILCLVSNSHAASFDCTKASTFIEKSICSDNQLSDLDDLLAQSYKKALTNSLNASTLKAEQRAWLANVRNKCQDPACLKRVYNERIAVLKTKISKDDENREDWGNSVQGKYVMSESPNHAGEVTITAVSGNKFKFSINTVFRSNTCEKEGVIILNATRRTATFKGEDDCVISFTFSDDSVKIVTKECNGYCGLNAFMDGVFIAE